MGADGGQQWAEGQIEGEGGREHAQPSPDSFSQPVYCGMSQTVGDDRHTASPS